MDNIDPAKLAALQAQLAQRGEKRTAEVAGHCAMPKPLEGIDANSTVLNAENPGALKAALAFPAADGAEPVKSDSDEQLLISLAFPQLMKLHAIKVSGPSDGNAPKTIKLFANKSNMDFSDCEDYPPTQTLTLSGVSQTLPLQLTKFLSVSSITVFIEDNQADEEVTGALTLEFVGVPVHTTNMNDLKKVG